MTEKLLQFIWKNRYFSQHELRLISGEALTIEYPGDINGNQGPDFLQARIRIGDTCWVGSVELHLLSSGWEKHGHENDDQYRNVILHVVWKQDRSTMVRNIPQLELFQRVSGMMLATYAGWMDRHHFIPCEHSLGRPASPVWEPWTESLLIRRLDGRTNFILDSLAGNHRHWEEQLWWMIAANFGLTVNATAFESMARSIPYTLLARHRNNPVQLEALFFGQANLLDGAFRDPYAIRLKKEFQFLKVKYRLKDVYGKVQFLRMRPDNFPTIRLSQLAALFGQAGQLFSRILVCGDLASLRSMLRVTANDYWNHHYVFDKPAAFREKILGRGTMHSIIINSVVPLLYAYGKSNGEEGVKKKAIRWLQTLPPEQNNRLTRWKSLGVPIPHAAGSQALLELMKTFCERYRCLECAIGRYLLQSSGGGPDPDGQDQAPTTAGQL